MGGGQLRRPVGLRDRKPNRIRIWRLKAGRALRKPGELVHKAHMFMQRGRRGWSDSDAWSIHSWAPKTFGTLLKHVGERHRPHG